MLTCRHVYALGFVKIVYNVGLTVVVTCLPMYIRGIFDDHLGSLSLLRYS